MTNWSILLVDDEEIIRQSYCKSLRHKGYTVTTADNGEDAIAKINSADFDLIITDLVMPGKGGLDVLAAAKDKAPNNAVIILTGYSEMSSALESLRLGVDDYLCKTCDITELVSRVERCRQITMKFRMAEKALRESYDLLESRVQERTRELEESNSTLNVLLRKWQTDQNDLEERMLSNVKQLVSPYLEKIKKSSLTPDQLEILDVLEKNLEAITSTFSVDFSSKHYQLTPTQLRIANLIALGRSSKEIADMTHLSIETVHNHRKSIRKKMGITKKNVNLQSLLSQNPSKN